MSGLAVLVLDASSNQPLPDAQIGIVDLPLAAGTDSAGFARLPRLAAGSYTVRVRAIGYKPMTDTLTIPTGGGRFLIVQLPRDLVCLPYPLDAPAVLHVGGAGAPVTIFTFSRGLGGARL